MAAGCDSLVDLKRQFLKSQVKDCGIMSIITGNLSYTGGVYIQFLSPKGLS
jgi:hypothetical protein